MTRIENCYKRFKDGDKIYKLAEENENSLLYKFHMYATKEKAKTTVSRELENFKPAYWNSCSCFRNAEVIKAFRTWAERIESPGEDHLAVMSNSFNRMSTFRISTYDKLENGNYYEIKFGYMKEIGELLKKGAISKKDEVPLNSILRTEFLNVFGTNYRPSPERIEKKVVIGRTVVGKKNRVNTRIKRIYENSLISEYYRDLVDNIAAKYETLATRDELEQMINKIDSELEKYRN